MSGDYLGIEGYEPVWLRGLRQVHKAHADRLARLVGRRLTRAWLLWDVGEDAWFADAPVLLDFDGEQLEVQHQKLDDLSLTWGTIDPDERVALPELDLRWRRDGRADVARLEGEVVRGVSLLEWVADDFARGMAAVHLRLEDAQVTITNGLDENRLEFGPPTPGYADHRLA